MRIIYNDLCIRNAFQEKGLGRVILSMLIEELFTMGYELIFLDTNLKNTRAQHVYELIEVSNPVTSIVQKLKFSGESNDDKSYILGCRWCT